MSSANTEQKKYGSKGFNPQRPTTALDKVNIRRMLLFIQKRVGALWRDQRHGNLSLKCFQRLVEEFLFDTNEKKGIFNYEFAVGEYSVLVGVQFREYSDWTWIELEKQTCNTLE